MPWKTWSKNTRKSLLRLSSTYGSNLYAETNDIYLVADVLGHNDVNTTKRHYASLSEEHRKSARNKVVLRE